MDPEDYGGFAIGKQFDPPREDLFCDKLLAAPEGKEFVSPLDASIQQFFFRTI